MDFRESRRSLALRLALVGIGAALALTLWLSPAGATDSAARDTSPCPGANNDVSKFSVEQVRSTLICAVNFERTSRGWPAFIVDDRLQRAAQKHADDMATRGYFGHFSPEEAGPEQRIEAEGYDWTSQRESLVAEPRTVAEVIRIFLENVEPCAYYFDKSFPVTDLGVGFAKAGGPSGGPIWVQQLGATSSSNFEGVNAAPDVSCPQALRGDYGVPGGQDLGTNVAPRTQIAKVQFVRYVDPGKKARAKFVFGSSEPGSTFRCKMDSRPFVKCRSPKIYRVGVGRHTFRVRAVDASGKPDPTPAKVVFRVLLRR